MPNSFLCKCSSFIIIYKRLAYRRSMVASAIVEEKHSNSDTVGNKVFHKDKFYLHDKAPHSKFHTK